MRRCSEQECSYVNETFYDKTFLNLVDGKNGKEAILWLVAENSGSSRDARMHVEGGHVTSFF